MDILALITSFVLSFFNPNLPQKENNPEVLAASTESQDTLNKFTFNVKSPAFFTEAVTFSKDIIAPNIISVLQAGDGILVDGNKITSSITQGITSLVAGTNISIDGNTITNTYSAPDVDYGLSGWTDNGTSITLTTLTDSVTVGSLTTGDIIADSLTTSGLALAGGLTVTSGNSLMPETDLGSDIGDATHRFNNLWVANINSNSSQSFSGQTTFSYSPTDTTITQASVLINPTTSAANGQLLGLGVGGYQRALIDADGDIILGYNSATSAPATAYPLDIYGHSGTRVSFTDTSGNGYFAGNVGIGTSSPGGKLEINSTTGTIPLWIKMNGSNTAYIASDGNTFFTPNITKVDSGAFVITSVNTLTFNSGNAFAMKLDTNGNVGIGTTSPTSKLHVSGAVTGKALTIFDETGNQNIMTASASGTTRMVLTNAGRLGLGTTSPAQILDVNGSITAAFSTYTQNSGQGYFYSNGNWGFSPLAGANRLGITANAVERLSIDSVGSVGIGTTTPTSRLHVSGATIGKALAIFDETGDQDIFTASASGTPLFTIKHDGKVGIGTTSPGAKLNVYSGFGDSIPEFSINEGGIYNINFGYDSQSLGSNKLNIYKNSSLTHIEDSHNGIYLGNTSGREWLTASNLGLALGGSDAVNSPAVTIVNATSNMGIGTVAPTSKLHVSGSTVGKALAIFDETGDQNLLTASASGVTKMNLQRDGVIVLGSTGQIRLNPDASSSNSFIRLGNSVMSWELYSGVDGYGGLGFYDRTNSKTPLLVNSSREFGFGDTITDGSTLAGANFVIKSTGRVGIGTTSPDRILHATVSDSGTGTTVFGQKLEHATSGTAAASFGIGTEYGLEDAAGTRYVAGDTGVRWSGTPTAGSPSSDFVVNLLQSGIYYQQALRVSNSGYLFLGGDTASYIARPSSNVLSLVTSNYSNVYMSDSGTIINNDNRSRYFQIKGNSGVESIYAGTTGLVGIGTASPTSKLHVTGAVTGKALAIFDETGDQNILTASASGTTKMVLTNAGRLGLGTLTPSYPIDVVGDIRSSANIWAGAVASAEYYGSGGTARPRFYGVSGAATSGEGMQFIGANPFTNTSGSRAFMLITTSYNQASGTASNTDLLISRTQTAVGSGTQLLLDAQVDSASKFSVGNYGLVKGTAGGLATYTKAGTISDTDFTDAAVDGLFGFDTTNHRLYFREGAAWSYIAKTGGFQIPNFESEGLSTGDFLVPYVESTMSDGAVHGLYAKWSEVKNTLLSDIWVKVNEIEAKVLALKDEVFTKKSHQEELCVGTSGSETCLNKEQLDKIIMMLPSTSPTPAPIDNPTPQASPSAEPTIEPTPTTQP